MENENIVKEAALSVAKETWIYNISATNKKVDSQVKIL